MNIQTDKAAHFLAGMALAALLAPFVLWWAQLPVVLVGAGKELLDRSGSGTYDPRDFWWTVAGGMVGVAAHAALLALWR